MRLKFTLVFLSTLLAYSVVSAQNDALSFTTANQDVAATVASTYIVPSSGDFSVEFWINVPSVLATYQEFVSQGTTGGGFYMGIDNAGQFRAGDNWQTTGANLPFNQWVHVALTDASGAATLYFNGVPVATHPSTPTPYTVPNAGTGSSFTMGNQFSPYTEYLTGTLDQVRVWNIALSQAQVKQTMYGTVASNTTGLVADYEMNDGSGSTVTNSTSTTGLDATLGSSGTNAAWVASPVQFGDNALNFDGSTTEVNAPANAAFEITSGTFEAEVNPTSLNSTNMEILGYRTTSPNTAYSFHISNTGVSMWNGITSTYNIWTYDHTLSTATGAADFTVPTGTWTQLSWVTDGTNTTLYVNGTSVGSFAMAPSSLTGQIFTIGASKENGPDDQFFNGNIDEVRVWNTQLTPAQISTYMGKTLSGSESGLNALYSFDQGIAGGTNTGLITAIDNTSNNNNATLSNFALTGSTSNFVVSNTVPLPVNFTSFTAIRSGDQALLQWQTAQEEHSHDFSIERSTDGVTYTAIGDVPAAGNSTKPTSYSFIDAAPKTGLNYYRLKESDIDGSAMYSVIRTVTFPTGASQQLVWYTTSSSSIEVNLSNGSNEFYTLYTVDGRTIQKGQLNAGKLYLSGLAGGMYIVNVNTFTGQQLTQRVLMP